MRTWQRSAMACTGSSAAARDADVGGEHRGDGVRLGRHVEHGERHVVQVRSCGVLPCAGPRSGEEASMNSRACCAAVESPPQHAQASDELVAGVDRDQIAFAAPVFALPRAPGPAAPRRRRRAVPTRGSAPLIAFHASRSSSDSVRRPGPGRTRRCGPARSWEEEGHADRNLQRLPRAAVQREIRERQDTDRAPPGSAARAGVGEQQIAGAADAHQLPRQPHSPHADARRRSASEHISQRSPGRPGSCRAAGDAGQHVESGLVIRDSPHALRPAPRWTAPRRGPAAGRARGGGRHRRYRCPGVHDVEVRVARGQRNTARIARYACKAAPASERVALRAWSR